MEVKTIYGSEINNFIPELAKLRITVFYDFPYLYEGSLEYEKNYLTIYPKSSESAIVLAIDKSQIIGAASCLPLKDETDYVQEPFVKNGFNLNSIYYFGESVLLKDFRGHGLGHKFFDGRENAAKKFGYKKTAFCAVVRDEHHSMRPAGYRTLDEFWIKRGYVKNPILKSKFKWLDIGDTSESEKEMIYWMKDLV